MPLEDEMAPVGTNLGDEMASAVVASQFQCHLTDVSSFYCWGQINNAAMLVQGSHGLCFFYIKNTLHARL
jgi:hypothetical protein